MVSAEHPPGSFNHLADKESRMDSDSWEWALHAQIFRNLMEVRGQCTVDLFSSRLSAKLPVYFSWRSDPGVKAVDPLIQSWINIRGYAFPTFYIIGRCLIKIRPEKTPWVLLITPLWKPQTWFPWLPSRDVSGLSNPTSTVQQFTDRSSGESSFYDLARSSGLHQEFLAK